MEDRNKTYKDVIGLFAALILFGAWAYLAVGGHLKPFDNAVQQFFFSLRNPILTPFCVALEYVGHWPLPAAICVLLLAIKKTRHTYGIPMACCVLTSVGMYELLKSIFKRPRPDASLWLCQEHGFSFPSGHSLNNMVFWIAFASLLGYYFIKKGQSLPVYKKPHKTKLYPKSKKHLAVGQTVLIAWPIIIGLSRVYVGVHWPSDVIGAWLLGFALLFTAKLILMKGRKHGS